MFLAFYIVLVSTHSCVLSDQDLIYFWCVSLAQRELCFFVLYIEVCRVREGQGQLGFVSWKQELCHCVQECVCSVTLPVFSAKWFNFEGIQASRNRVALLTFRTRPLTQIDSWSLNAVFSFLCNDFIFSRRHFLRHGWQLVGNVVTSLFVGKQHCNWLLLAELWSVFDGRRSEPLLDEGSKRSDLVSVSSACLCQPLCFVGFCVYLCVSPTQLLLILLC